jgi:hypothetical protein
MVRLYGDPVRDGLEVVDVRRDIPAAPAGPAHPEQFLWRGRLYVVRSVLAHWVEIGAWWRARSPDGLPERIDDSGCQVWRVEASAGRGAALGVFDLTFDEAAASWTLTRALD